jgi:superfamily II DNA or RNA helicase
MFDEDICDPLPDSKITRLRPYQVEVIEQCQKQFLAGNSRIYLVAPTGSGAPGPLATALDLLADREARP